jgi:hypothetical protein
LEGVEGDTGGLTVSYAHGAVRFSDGTIKYFEFNGYEDYCYRKLFDEKHKLSPAGSDNLLFTECSCGQESEYVEMVTEDCGGFYWKGTACRNCMVITGGVRPKGIVWGYPDWIDANGFYDD